jgi:16S rRNA (guanine966-N2)-methyltransferase
LRIIGGKYKGRKIKPPVWLKARPTTDFARESLFNILNNRIDFESVDVLDLFSGTGSIAFEFASRGALNVHLVERNIRYITAIKGNIREIGFKNIRAIHIDVRTFLRTCTFKYDVVFADPPYDLAWLEDVPSLILKSGALKDDGIFILEHPGTVNFRGHEGFLEHRNYGSVNFTFFNPVKVRSDY